MGVKAVLAAIAMVPAIVHAAPPKRPVLREGTAPRFGFVAERPDADGFVLARQVLPATGATAKAQSRIIYLNPYGVDLYPGDNDSMTGTSSIVSQPVELYGWNTDDQTWADTLACVQEIYARFDVTVTDQDPGNVPHIEAVIGGSPGDVGLPDNVAGVSPFTEDCGIIDNSIVFTFTDVLPDDARTVCEVMSQEIAHSFGLDHEMLPSDPMTYLDYDGNREFQDQQASCGEYAERPCGINGSVCRAQQSSVALLTARVGTTSTTMPPGNSAAPADDGGGGGCSAGGSGGLAISLAALGLIRRRRG
jgi:hypothetical protein